MTHSIYESVFTHSGPEANIGKRLLSANSCFSRTAVSGQKAATDKRQYSVKKRWLAEGKGAIYFTTKYWSAPTEYLYRTPPVIEKSS